LKAGKNHRVVGRSWRFGDYTHGSFLHGGGNTGPA
jgi:hypothetical protein